MSAGVSEKGNIDFTKGSIIQNMILFSVPVVLGELFQNFYNSVDALVVGNFVGKYALGAVSVCDTIARLLVGFFTGMSAGVSVVVARIFGSGDREKLKRSMRVTFSFGAVLGTVLAAIGILLAPALLRLTGAEEGVYLQGLIYLRIYLGGLVFTVAYNVGAGILRAIGDSRTPFRILVVTCVTNIVLDLLLVAAFGLGIAGVSFATVCSQFLSVVLVYRKLRETEDSFRICISEIPGGEKADRRGGEYRHALRASVFPDLFLQPVCVEIHQRVRRCGDGRRRGRDAARQVYFPSHQGLRPDHQHLREPECGRTEL